MQSVVENLSALSRKITVTVPQDQVKQEFDKRLNKLAKEANLKGFRKGKVPVAIIKRHYHDSIAEEVIQSLINQTLEEEVYKKFSLVDRPRIDLKNFNENEPFEYAATFEVYPEVKLNLEGISVERPQAEVNDQHVSEVIEKLRKQNTIWKEVDRSAEKGDMLVIDFEGFIDDVVFEGGSAKNIDLELGNNNMIPGFEEPLYGVKAGDTVEVPVIFPENYHANQYAGKAAKFVVKVHKVKEGELPSLDNAFAKDLGVTTGELTGLYQEVKENLQRELELRIHDQVKTSLIDKLLAQNTLEVPEGLVAAEISRLMKAMEQQWVRQTGQKVAPQLPKEQFQEQARKNVMLGLFFSQCIQDHKIEVDKAKVRQRVEEIASGYHHSQEMINWYYTHPEALKEVESFVLEQQALDKLLEKVEVIEKPTTFDEIMNLSADKEDK